MRCGRSVALITDDHALLPLNEGIDMQSARSPHASPAVMGGLLALAGILLLAGCGGGSSAEPTAPANAEAVSTAAAEMPAQDTASAGTSSAAVAPASVGTLADADAAATAAAVTCDGGSVPCALGNTGPGGGLVFYVDPAGFACNDGATCTALEGAPAGWSGQADDPIGVWCMKDQPGFEALNTDGGTFDSFSTVIGTGLANTRMIVDACGEATAAGVASAYTGGGLTDWYLPSIGEFLLLARPMFDTGTTQVWNGLNNGWVYWTSSQSDPGFIGPNAAETGGVPMTAGNGGIGTVKTEVATVHPIRAF
jgi:hypothetical protein